MNQFGPLYHKIHKYASNENENVRYYRFVTSLKKLFPYPLIAFLFGVGIAPALSFLNSLLLLLCAAFLCVALVYRRKHFLYVALIIGFAVLGMLRYASWKEAPRDASLESRVGSSVEIDAVVDDEPDLREGSTNLIVAVHAIRAEGTSTVASGRILISVARYPEFQYGDVVRVNGKLVRPKKFIEDDGRVFDYPSYLAVKGIHYQIPFPITTPLGQNEGNMILSTLFTMKHQFLGVLSTILPEPHNALLGGLLLGGKQSLGTEWQDIFRDAGIIHVVVLSGYNMTIVSEWLVRAFGFLGFYGSLSVGGVGIVLFALMTGAGATVLRAAIMALIALLARATGRTYTMGRALLIAGVCMVIQNPSILIFDPSFQLSFLASLGLIFVSPVIEARTKLFLQFPVWREVFISTLSTQVMVLPLLLSQTGILSLVSLPVNMLVLPVIPFTMLFGFIAGVVATVVPALGVITAVPAHALLAWVLFVASSSVQIPYAAISVPLSSGVVLVVYILLAIILWRAHASLRHVRRGVTPQSPLLNSVGDKKETE